ncbi:hypothetical protein SAMN02745673_03191 [Marinactinospora thermotolerans DSM 45154]|uniref:Uncharacterized protein n=1 Tax=Marinactinospora thermotolerans DSM 45154 TaxID=1122192 RepID=A0A1T4S4J9_9ACTN|nr:hypothetical protein SAMN02745673_03191 [Marinactinospora thermotolerans DSM 45154]
MGCGAALSAPPAGYRAAGRPGARAVPVRGRLRLALRHVRPRDDPGVRRVPRSPVPEHRARAGPDEPTDRVKSRPPATGAPPRGRRPSRPRTPGLGPPSAVAPSHPAEARRTRSRRPRGRTRTPSDATEASGRPRERAGELVLGHGGPPSLALPPAATGTRERLVTCEHRPGDVRTVHTDLGAQKSRVSAHPPIRPRNDEMNAFRSPSSPAKTPLHSAITEGSDAHKARTPWRDTSRPVTPNSKGRIRIAVKGPPLPPKAALVDRLQIRETASTLHPLGSIWRPEPSESGEATLPTAQGAGDQPEMAEIGTGILESSSRSVRHAVK